MKSKTKMLLMVVNILAWVVFIGLMINAGSVVISHFISIGNAQAAKNLYGGMDYTFIVKYKAIIEHLFIL